VVWMCEDTLANIYAYQGGGNADKEYILYAHPPRPATLVGVSHLNTRQSAVRRLPEQDDEGETTPNNPANAMARWAVTMQGCGTALTRKRHTMPGYWEREVEMASSMEQHQ